MYGLDVCHFSRHAAAVRSRETRRTDALPVGRLRVGHFRLRLQVSGAREIVRWS